MNLKNIDTSIFDMMQAPSAARLALLELCSSAPLWPAVGAPSALEQLRLCGRRISAGLEAVAASAAAARAEVDSSASSSEVDTRASFIENVDHIEAQEAAALDAAFVAVDNAIIAFESTCEGIRAAVDAPDWGAGSSEDLTAQHAALSDRLTGHLAQLQCALPPLLGYSLGSTPRVFPASEGTAAVVVRALPPPAVVVRGPRAWAYFSPGETVLLTLSLAAAAAAGDEGAGVAAAAALLLESAWVHAVLERAGGGAPEALPAACSEVGGPGGVTLAFAVPADAPLGSTVRVLRIAALGRDVFVDSAGQRHGPPPFPPSWPVSDRPLCLRSPAILEGAASGACVSGGGEGGLQARVPRHLHPRPPLS